MVLGDPDLEGMGTTLTALLRAGSRFGLVHIGDSRCYLLRGDELQQITQDHTFVQTLVDEGRITAEEASHHPQRNVIMRALDGREDVELDLSIREAKAGDRYLLCSDGLSGVVSEETMRDTLAGADSPDHAAEQLVELALRGGGPDNITAIVADVVDVDAGPSATPVTVGAAAEGTGTHGRPPTRPRPRQQPWRRDRSAEPYDGETDEGRPRHWGRRIVALVLLLALLGGGGAAAWAWSQQQYYVGAADQNVAIFRGLPQDVGPIKTSRLYRSEDIPLEDLPAYQRERVRSEIPASGLSDAQRIVTNLREQAEICRAATASPTPTSTRLEQRRRHDREAGTLDAGRDGDGDPVGDDRLDSGARARHRARPSSSAAETAHERPHRRPQPAQRRAGAAGVLGGDRDGRLRRGRARPRRCGARRDDRLRRGPRLPVRDGPPGAAPVRPQRRPRPAAGGHPDQRHRPGHDPSPRRRRRRAGGAARPGRALRGRTRPADVDRGRRGAVHRRARRGARPPHPAAVHLHRDARRPRPAAAAAAARHRYDDQRRPDLDPRRRLLVPAGRARQARAAGVLRGLPRRQARRAGPGRPTRAGRRPAAGP